MKHAQQGVTRVLKNRTLLYQNFLSCRDQIVKEKK